MDEYNEVPQSGEEAEEQAPRRPGTDLFEWLQLFLGCVIVAVVLFNCAARLTRVDGESMDNTLQHGEILLIWSLGYTPQQGDVVVLNKTSTLLPGWTEPHAIVKRVIATGAKAPGGQRVHRRGQPRGGGEALSGEGLHDLRGLLYPDHRQRQQGQGYERPVDGVQRRSGGCAQAAAHAAVQRDSGGVREYARTGDGIRQRRGRVL